LYNLVFSFKTKAYLKNTIFQKPGDTASKLYFLQKGCIEVFTYDEGGEFVIERLFRGSVLNYHTFFQEDHNSEVYLRFARNSILKELELSRMLELCE
jgi:CRP-like cAMP-binding protein